MSVGVLIALAVALLILIEYDRTPGTGDRRFTPDTGGTAAVQETLGDPVAADVARDVEVTRISIGLLCRIVDYRTGADLPEAFLADATDKRFVLRSDFLGRATSQGVWIDIADVPTRLGAFAPGYVGRVFDRSALDLPPSSPSPMVIQLAPAERIRFVCEYVDGTPVGDVMIGVARSVLPARGQLESMRGHAGHPVYPCDENLGCFVGRSGRDGMLVLEQLPAGTFHAITSHPHAELCDDSLANGIRMEEGIDRLVRLQFQKRVGFRLRSTGQQILTWRWQGDRGRYAGTGSNSTATLAAVVANYEARRSLPSHVLEDRWLPAPRLPGAGDRLRVEVCLQPSGWTSHTIEVQWADQLEDQFLPETEQGMPAPDSSGVSLIRIPQASHAEHITMHLMSPEHGSTPILARPGSSVWLPHGIYQISDASGHQITTRDKPFSWSGIEDIGALLSARSTMSVCVRATMADGSIPHFLTLRAEWSVPDAAGVSRRVSYARGMYNGRHDIEIPESTHDMVITIGPLHGVPVERSMKLPTHGVVHVVVPVN